MSSKMTCMGSRFCEDRCHCQQFNQDPNPSPTYMTPSVSQPYAITNSTHGSHHHNTPTYCQSTVISPTNVSTVPESTFQFTQPNLSFHNNHPPSTLLYGISAERGYSPSISFDLNASVDILDTLETGFEWRGQNNPGHEPIQDIITGTELSIEPEVSWSHSESSDLQTASYTAKPSAISSPVYLFQAHPSEGYGVSGFSNYWDLYSSQQNNTMTWGIEELQVPIGESNCVSEVLTDLRVARPPGSTGTLHTLANGVQSSYSTPYSYQGSQTQEPSTELAMQTSPANNKNQHQYPLLDAMSGQDHILGKCPHPKCQLGNTKVFTKSSELRGHWYRTHDKRYPCLKCIDTIFGTSGDLKRHSTALHSDDPKEFICHVECCNARAKEFNRKDRLKEHKEKWHGRHHCPMENCPRGLGNGFKDQKLLDEHVRKSHGYTGSCRDNA